MAAHSYIETEDMGLTVLGVPQYTFTVNGVHRQDFDTAIYRAALCRTVACEQALNGFVALVQARQKKLEDLGYCLAELNASQATKTKDTKTSDELSVDSKAASLLRQYGFEGSAKIALDKLMKMTQDVQYAMDQEDNELQQNMTTMQSFVSKRDDAMQMSGKLMKKVAKTRQKGISYIV